MLYDGLPQRIHFRESAFRQDGKRLGPVISRAHAMPEEMFDNFQLIARLEWIKKRTHPAWQSRKDWRGKIL